MATKTREKSSTTPRTRPAARSGARGKSATTGKHLVIVESPTKAKTINRYVGQDYVVMASIGHVRDLPTKATKSSKVPGVDVERNFEPTYEILPSKKKTVDDLKRAAAGAIDVWFATDLDREGEAIAWHLAEALGVPVPEAKRVVFNAITRSEIQRSFAHPRKIDANRVNAQQARRILDRIVGFQVSPLLWRKVAAGLSAGRVQSVAVRLVADRERQIEAFMPEEFWTITCCLSTEPKQAASLADQWMAFLKSAPEGKDWTVKEQMAWLSDRACLKAEVVQVAGVPFKATSGPEALAIAQRLGFVLTDDRRSQDPKAKGPARSLCFYSGTVATGPAFTIESIQTRRTRSKPPAPFITSTLQQAAANRLGFTLKRTMRVAQQLYEGLDIHGGDGQVGLITYMRTDSTHLSNEALDMARAYIDEQWSADYLPDEPNVYASAKSAQEAHEAIRPTDLSITPQRVRRELSDEQGKIYQLIWQRFLASQMTPAQWDQTTAMIRARDDAGPVAVLKATGRTLVFDGFYKVLGPPASAAGHGEGALLPPLAEDQALAPIQIDPRQRFTSAPARYTEASLQKKLEEEGIGRPSTYAPIIATIQDRRYVQPIGPGDRRLMATDIGRVVTDMLVEAFPNVMDVAYTRDMESELDKIESQQHDWRTMLQAFYGPFKANLERAHKELVHAKAVTEPAPHRCVKCEAETVYRFGRNGKFLSCSRYPDCDYAAPIDSEGNPVEPEQSDILCPLCQANMTRRLGRFGPFLGCIDYPKCKGIVKLNAKKGTVVLPKAPPLTTDLACPKCDEPLYLRRSKRGPWLSCSKFPKCRGRSGWSTLDEKQQAAYLEKLDRHERDNPVPQIRTVDGRTVGDDYVPLSGNRSSSDTPADDNTADVLEPDLV